LQLTHSTIFININKQKFNFTNQVENIEAINFQTGLKERIGIKKWTFDNQNIANNYSLFNSLAISSKTIYLLLKKIQQDMLPFIHQIKSLISTNSHLQKDLFLQLKMENMPKK
jgi:beta-lactamase class D